MRRSSARFVLIAATAALLVRAASAQTPAGCLEVDSAELEPAVAAAELIVIAQVGGAGGSTHLLPEAYLKGPATADPIRLVSRPDGCEPATLQPGGRVLLFLDVVEGQVLLPGAGATFVLEDGRATGGAQPSAALTEARLVADIRSVTGQYAVPAGAEGGAGIEWLGTVGWVAGALLIVFLLGLVLMRVWHRIDPS